MEKLESLMVTWPVEVTEHLDPVHAVHPEVGVATNFTV